MPGHKKENTPPENIVSQEDLKPENFHQYLRTEIRQATRIVMEEIMREELSGFLGAKWGESTPERKGSNADGSGGQCQYDQSLESDPHSAIGSVA